MIERSQLSTCNSGMRNNKAVQEGPEQKMNSICREKSEEGVNDDAPAVNRGSSQRLSAALDPNLTGDVPDDLVNGVLDRGRKGAENGCDEIRKMHQDSGNGLESIPSGIDPLRNSFARASGADDNEDEQDTTSQTDNSEDGMDQMEQELASALQMVFEGEASKRKLEEENAQLKAGYTSTRSENEELVNDMQEILGENEELVTQLHEHMKIEQILADENYQLKQERDSLLENLEKAQEVRMQPDEAAQKVEALKDQLRRKVNFMTAEKMDLESQIKQLRFELGEAHERAESIDREKQLVQMQLSVSNQKLRRCACNVRLENGGDETKIGGPSHWREVINIHLEANASPEVLKKQQVKREPSGNNNNGRMRRRASFAMPGLGGNNGSRENDLNNAACANSKREIQSVVGKTILSPPSQSELSNGGGGSGRQRRRMSLSAGISMGIEAMRGSTTTKPLAPENHEDKSRELSLTLPPITSDAINLEGAAQESDEPQLPSGDVENVDDGAESMAAAAAKVALELALLDDSDDEDNNISPLKQEPTQSFASRQPDNQGNNAFGDENKRASTLSQQKLFSSFNTETPTERIGNTESGRKRKSGLKTVRQPPTTEEFERASEAESSVPYKKNLAGACFEICEDSTVSGLSLDSTLISATKRSLDDFPGVAHPKTTLQQHLEEQEAIFAAKKPSDTLEQSLVSEASTSSRKTQKSFLSGFAFGNQRTGEQKGKNRDMMNSRGNCTGEGRNGNTATPSSAGKQGILQRLSRQPQRERPQNTTRAFWQDDQSGTSLSIADTSVVSNEKSPTAAASVSGRSTQSLGVDGGDPKKEEEKPTSKGKGAVDEPNCNLLSSFTNERWGNVAQNALEDFNVKNLNDKNTEGMLLVPHEEDDVVFEGWG